jgi:predicted O-linked N-acetylglucosamine transferase (SPINDLY family)
MTDWIAESPEEYAEIARQKSGDLAALSELRSSLRARMQASPLMNPAQFALGMEDAFRTMWKTWCQSTP